MSEEEQVASLRHLNALVYARPSSGSLIAERTQKLSYPASLSYNLGSTMQFIINSGAESVWGPSSYLRLKIEMTTTATPVLKGSWFNLFSQVRLYHRSGELLEQVFFSDILSAIKLRYNTSFSDYQKLYSLIGGAAVVGAAGDGGVAAGAGARTVYVNLPLSLLLGVFDNHSQFIPGSALLAGARLELVLNSSVESMALTNVTGATISITPTLSLDCAKVYDEAQKQIMEESADVQESGIQFTYSTYFASQFQPAGGAINIDVLQSASLTEKVFIVNTTVNATDKYTFRPLLAGGAGYAYQFRIGAHYLPIYSVQDDTEAFYQAQIAFNGAYNQFSRPPTHTGVGVPSFGDSNCVYATSLEKSASGVNLSGEPTNNSRLINFSAQGTTSGGSVATVFLQYVRVANCMLDSCVVDR